MTKAILQTDIELARSLIAGDRSDDEVALALTRRGIEPSTAARLVDDLRNGRRVQPDMPAAEWVGGRSASRRRKTDAPTQSSAKPAETPRSDHKRSHRSGKDEPQSKAVVWFTGGVLACALIAGAILYLNHRHNDRSDTENRKTSKVPLPAPEPKTQSQSRQTALELKSNVTSAFPQSKPRTNNGPVVELQTNGLYIAGTLLTRDGASSNVATLLGPPTRTNEMSATKRPIYAYDQHGILLYGDKGDTTGSVVLDFEGAGGTNGTRFPFLGTLRIGNHLIERDTDPRALTSIQGLEFKHPNVDGGLFAGQYNAEEVIFSYLEFSQEATSVKVNTQRLSLVEFTLKEKAEEKTEN